MHRTVRLAAPITAALLAACACSSNGAGPTAAPTPAPSDNLNACRIEDVAYRQAAPVIQGGTGSANAASVVDAYAVQLDVAETYAAQGSAFFNHLYAVYKNAYALENELIIQNTAGATQDAKATETARHAVVSDCRALGYPYPTDSAD